MRLEFSPYIAFRVKDCEKALGFREQVMGIQLIRAGGHEVKLIPT